MELKQLLRTSPQRRSKDIQRQCEENTRPLNPSKLIKHLLKTLLSHPRISTLSKTKSNHILRRINQHKSLATSPGIRVHDIRQHDRGHQGQTRGGNGRAHGGLDVVLLPGQGVSEDDQADGADEEGEDQGGETVLGLVDVVVALAEVAGEEVG